MKRIDWKQLTGRRALGIGLIILGGTVMFAPIVFGEWIISLLGIALIVAGLLLFAAVVRAADRMSSLTDYAAGAGTIALGLVLFASPNIAVVGLLLAVTLVFVTDGAFKIFNAFILSGHERRWAIFNGLFVVALGVSVWYFLSVDLGILAIGVILGLRLLVEGWAMCFLPEKGFGPPDFAPDERLHPDVQLGLEPNDYVKNIRAEIAPSFAHENGSNVVWC